MPFQIALVTYKNRLPPRFEIQISFWNGYSYGGFRSRRGAERHAILLFIIETAKKQGLNILTTIQAALSQSLVFAGG